MLARARSHLGHSYRGDIDAPRAEIVSEPRLAASMDLPGTDDEVWAALARTAAGLAERCDVYAIACNTLGIYEPRLLELDLPAELVSFPAAVAAWAEREGIERVGLLGALPVTRMGEWSPYRSLAKRIIVETPPDPDAVHDLILAVKTDGGTDPAHSQRLAEIAQGFESEFLLLACTEFPLVAAGVPGHRFIDVTDLVADDLVRRWLMLR